MNFHHKLLNALHQAQDENKRVALYVDRQPYTDFWGVPQEIGFDYVVLLSVDVNSRTSQEDFDLPTASRCTVTVKLDTVSSFISDFHEIQEEELEKLSSAT